MLLYHTNSWHYRLVLYIFTKEFFLETTGLDFKAMDSQYNAQTKQEGEFEFIYKKKTKTINFCPYCRAVVAAITCLPLVYLWRLYPHKPTPKKTHDEIMKDLRRRNWKIRIVLGTFNGLLGIKNIIYGMDDGMYIGGIIQIILSVIFFTIHLWGDKITKWIILDRHEIRQKFRMCIRKLISICVPKWMRRTKYPQPKKPSKIMQKIQSKHDVYCPPIFFVESIDQEKLK